MRPTSSACAHTGHTPTTLSIPTHIACHDTLYRRPACSCAPLMSLSSLQVGLQAVLAPSPYRKGKWHDSVSVLEAVRVTRRDSHVKSFNPTVPGESPLP